MGKGKNWLGGSLALFLSLVLLFLTFASPSLRALGREDPNQGEGDGANIGEIIVGARLVQHSPPFVRPIRGLKVSLIDPAQKNETSEGILAIANTDSRGLVAFAVPAGSYEVRLQFATLESSLPIEVGSQGRRLVVQWTFIREILRSYSLRLHDPLGSGLLLKGDKVEVLFPSKADDPPTFLELYFEGSSGLALKDSTITRLASLFVPEGLNRVVTILVLRGSASGSQIWVEGTPQNSFRLEELKDQGEPSLAAYWLVNRVARFR